MNVAHLISITKLVLGISRVATKRKLPILIVEDNERDAELLGHFVRQEGFAFEHCRTTESARERVLTGKWHCVLLDLHFKGDAHDGLRFHNWLTSRSRLPVIFVTGHPKSLEAIPPGNCCTFITKGIEAASLQMAISRALAKARGLNGDADLPGVFIAVWILCTLSVGAGYVFRLLHELKP